MSFFCILEISNCKDSRDTGQVYLKVLAKLRRSRIGVHSILSVIIPTSPEPVQVPDFGHNVKCQCPKPEPFGVSRYFGVYLEMSGGELELYKTYWVFGRQAQITICGKTLFYNGSVRHELQEVQP